MTLKVNAQKLRLKQYYVNKTSNTSSLLDLEKL